jgi:NAD(P)-dependent dehydrogenase (short-subunit alcohol dehydrogenase family)
MNPISLEGKVAVVTGGAGGIGRGIAESFAQLGARVIVADSNAESVSRLNEESSAQGWSIEAVECDVTKTEPVRALMERVQSREKRLDILVNNVGDTLRLYKPFEEMTDENIDDLFGILLRHVMVCTREAIPLIKGSGDGGSIISISSIEGYRGLPNIVPYAAFKLGIEGFTKSLALELGPFGIRVNSIAPETTESESIRPSRWISPENEARIPHWIPLGRFGRPSDTAGCAVFLASSLSAWVTGTTLHCDGGSLAAAGWYRLDDNRWTNTPIIEGSGI